MVWETIAAAAIGAAGKAATPAQAGPLLPESNNQYHSGDWNVATSGSKLNAGVQWYVWAVGAVVVIYAVKRFTRK